VGCVQIWTAAVSSLERLKLDRRQQTLPCAEWVGQQESGVRPRRSREECCYPKVLLGGGRELAEVVDALKVADVSRPSPAKPVA
jgi:hypothetical protein